jgi:spermidine synthase
MSSPLPPGPPEELGRAHGPHGEVALRRRGRVLELVVDGVFAMDDVDTSTERVLATETLRRVDGGWLRVLVGGLGLGWTTAAVLADPRVAAVEVAELHPALVGWARAGLLSGLPDAGDPRLTLTAADVADVLARSAGRFDAVLLDVDNGPGFLVHEHNARLYAADGLAAALAALRPGGVLAVWSSEPAPELLAALAALPAAVDAEQLLLGVHRDGRAFDYAVLLARRR